MVERFKRELSRLIPTFEARVVQLNDQVKQSNINRSTAIVADMWEFILDVRS
jgi:hypothetical protein